MSVSWANQLTCLDKFEPLYTVHVQHSGGGSQHTITMYRWCGDVEVWLIGGREVWRSGCVDVWRCEGVEVWRCGGVKVWKCEGVEVGGVE